MRRKSVLTILMVIAMLAFVVGNAVAAWQETKTTQSMAVVVEPDPAGTFRIVRTSCYAYVDYHYDDWNGYCYTTVKNDTDAIVVVEVVTVASEDARVEEVEIRTTIPMAINARATGEFSFFYKLQSGTLATYEPVVFDIEVTASGN